MVVYTDEHVCQTKLNLFEKQKLFETRFREHLNFDEHLLGKTISHSLSKHKSRYIL